MILFYIRNSYILRPKLPKNSYISCKNNPIFLLYFGKDLVDSLKSCLNKFLLMYVYPVMSCKTCVHCQDYPRSLWLTIEYWATQGLRPPSEWPVLHSSSTLSPGGEPFFYALRWNLYFNVRLYFSLQWKIKLLCRGLFEADIIIVIIFSKYKSLVLIKCYCLIWTFI